MKNILILGANSAMARAQARELASPNVQLILASRNPQETEKTAQDLVLRSKTPKPMVIAFDANQLEQHEKIWTTLLKKVNTVDEVYVFFGLLHPQQEAQQDFKLTHEMLVANYVGAVSILERIASHMEQQGKGVIVCISSVAGDRGRQSNYLYGSAKAGLSAYLQGLRNRLFPKGVHVITVKPGFVDTPMTAGLKKGLLFAKPESIAKGICRAVAKRKDVVYLPGYWSLIMLIVIHVPEFIFKRMKM